ncbi:MAG: serine/threonine-protein kinase [Thiobacillus sp.]
MVSQTKFGRYEVVSALGQGAMGAVYKAVDPLIERTVAIKTINLDLSKEERADFEARFYREAKSAGRLSHSNIVTIYDVGETDDIAYIAMEYLEGESLREMLDSGVVFPPDLISRIAAQIASALNYAHENNVVHRDIKPANIMITPNRDVKIMDFGIAQIPTGSRTQAGTVLGSPKYMAPEQVAGQATDGRTDIFALGVVLYEMLTGVTPFNGDNLSAIMYKILNEDPAPPSTVNLGVPPAFDRIISRALAKRPEDRYQTAREFARDLGHEAFIPQGARQSAASKQPVESVQASRARAAQQDATLYLPPHKASGVFAIPPAGSGRGIQAKIASFMGHAQLRRTRFLLAIPVLLVAAFVLVLQGLPPKRVELPAPVAPRLETERVNTPTPTAAPASEIAVPLAKPKAAPAVAASAIPQAPAAVVQAKATVMLAISPWGEVFVDGRRVGVSPPLAMLQLEPGKHEVEIRNQTFVPYRVIVNPEPGKSHKIRHKFK